MPGFDIYKMDQDWRQRQEQEEARKAEEKAAAEKAAAEEAAREAGEHGGSGDSGGTSQAEETADNAIGDTSREAVIRQQMAEGAAKPEAEVPEPEPETDALKLSRMPAYQGRAARIMANSLTLKNAQKVVAISTRENIRKGLAKGQVQQKPGRGTQTSTVAIPTALLRYVQQEIGSTRLKLNQNDAMAGFLYWYFGMPDDVAFQDEAAYEKALDASESLKVNASPARMGQVNYNLSASLLDKLEVMSERLDGIAGTLGLVKNDGTELKLRADKSYIAVCYLLLNYLGFAPLVAPGQRPSDLDLMVGGLAWDLMAGVDDALDWLRTTDGREKYKAKHGQRAAKPTYQPAAPPRSPDGWAPAATPVQPVQQPDDDEDEGDGWDAYLDSEEEEEGYLDVDEMDDLLDDVDDDGYDPADDDPDAETAKEAKSGDLSLIMQEAARNKRAAAIAEISMRKQQARQNNN